MDANAKSFVDHGLVEVLSKVVGKGIDDLSFSESFEYLPRVIATWYALLHVPDGMKRTMEAKAADMIKKILDVTYGASCDEDMREEVERVVIEALTMLERMVAFTSKDSQVIKDADQLWKLCTDDSASSHVRECVARVFAVMKKPVSIMKSISVFFLNLKGLRFR